LVISLMTVAQKLTAPIMNQIIGAVNQIALNGIVPASVAGTGVTVSPNGVVTFTNASTVSLNGVFSGSFDNYRVTWNSSTRSAAVSAGFKLRAAGTDLTSSTYDYVKGVDSGTARSVTSSSSNGNFPIDHGIAAAETSNGVMDIFAPALVSATTGTIQSSVLASSACYSTQVSFANESAASYDGFSLSVSSGTWSGTVRVYGYNNLT
jgi:hypothetical protein